MSALYLFLPVILVAFFLCAFCGALVLISRQGWHQLAERFATAQSPSGQAFPRVRGRVGKAGYNGTLNVHITARGLLLSVPFFWRIAHPPLLIPWDEIRDVQQERRRYVSYCFTIGSPPITTVTLPEKVVGASDRLRALSERAPV